METWRINQYRAPQLVSFSARLDADGNTVVLAADANEYKLAFNGVEGGRVLDSVLAMANPGSEIWFDIHSGTAQPWQLSLARQLDELSLIRDAPAGRSALEMRRLEQESLIQRCVCRLLAVCSERAALHAPIALAMLRLLDEPPPVAGAFSLGEVGAPEWADNFALQTFHLQKLYLEDNLPQLIPLWRRVLQGFAEAAGLPLNAMEAQGRVARPDVMGFYCPTQEEAYLLCLVELVRMAPAPRANRLLPGWPSPTMADSGVNFMRRARQCRRSGLAQLGESGLTRRMEREGADSGVLVQGLFIEQYHVSRRFAEIIAPLMIKRMRLPLKQHVHRYFQEELGREVYGRSVCEALGVPAAWLDQALPLPLFQAYVDAFTVLGRYDPIGYLAALTAFEGGLGMKSLACMQEGRVAEERACYSQAGSGEGGADEGFAALPQLFFREMSLLGAAAQRRALDSMAYMMELGHRALEQVASFYGGQARLTMCSLDSFDAE
ncbi:hypothetical protein [Chromobacterium phragmitis]|uniref:Uncharacterized protein n=2 Tax=Chromobacterium phragmitis TaxID=2202141 RepID=A0A344UFC7_9NEIS|nr:hypothetical protein [Chromobacterium phragmitis]AXE33975.1 hypothetical protein DK843_06475 [Chromobacterium phragmitis]